MKGSFAAIRFSGAGLFFVGAGLLAALAALSIFGYLRAAVPSVGVLVVSRDLEPGAVVQAADMELRRVPAAALPDGAFRSPDAAVGRRLRYGLTAGDFLRERHLVPPENSDLAIGLSKFGDEYRAVMLPAELVPGTDHLIPGDRLELTGTLPVQDQRSNTVVALPVGTALVMSVNTAKGQSDKSTVLVALPASEVSRLALAMRAGTLTVAVLGSGEASKPAPPLRLDTLTAVAAPPGSPPAAPSGSPSAAPPASAPAHTGP